MAARIRTSTLRGLDLPHPAHFPFLKHPQQLGLQIEGQLGDLVEEQGPAVGGGEETGAFPVGPGEGSPGVTEEFAFDQGRRNGAAVDGDEGPLFTSTVVVNAPGDQFLAGTGLPGDQHRRGGGCNLVGQFDHLSQSGAAADQLARWSAAGYLGPKLPVFALELQALFGLFQGQHHLIGFEWLGDIVIGPRLHAFEGRLDGAVGAHHDHRGGGVQFHGLAQKAMPVHPRHADVAQDHVRLRLLQELEPGLPPSASST